MSEPNILGEAKLARLRCFGHVDRMGENRAAKKSVLGTTERLPTAGRPWCHWKNEVHKDLKDLGTFDWQEQPQNWGAWRNLV